MSETDLFNKSFLLPSWFEPLSAYCVILKNERSVCMQSSGVEGVGPAVG